MVFNLGSNLKVKGKIWGLQRETWFRSPVFRFSIHAWFFEAAFNQSLLFLGKATKGLRLQNLQIFGRENNN